MGIALAGRAFVIATVDDVRDTVVEGARVEGGLEAGPL